MGLRLDFHAPRDEDESVRLWEMEQFIELGADPVTAAFAAAAGVSWHDVAGLMSDGCGFELALEIAS